MINIYLCVYDYSLVRVILSTVLIDNGRDWLVQLVDRFGSLVGYCRLVGKDCDLIKFCVSDWLKELDLDGDYFVLHFE